MYKGKLKSGFEYEIDESVMDNMELVDALAEGREDDPLAISKICRLILGEENRKRLYETVRTEDGRVPLKEISSAIKELFEQFGESGKN